jgi:hypothetical protein
VTAFTRLRQIYPLTIVAFAVAVLAGCSKPAEKTEEVRPGVWCSPPMMWPSMPNFPAK